MSRYAILPVALVAALLFAAPAARAATVEDAVRLLEGGVGERVVLEQIEAEGLDEPLSTGDILALKRAGASDELIRELIRSSRSAPDAEVSASQGTVDEEDLADRYGSGPLEDRYASPLVHARLYYDPFGYYWYPWPWSFAYYYPFSWIDCGFYYAGWWDHRWWRHGSWCGYYRDRYCGPYAWHWDGSHGDRRGSGRHAWDRSPGGRRGGDDGGRYVEGRPATSRTPSDRSRTRDGRGAYDDRRGPSRGDGRDGGRQWTDRGGDRPDRRATVTRRQDSRSVRTGYLRAPSAPRQPSGRASGPSVTRPSAPSRPAPASPGRSQAGRGGGWRR